MFPFCFFFARVQMCPAAHRDLALRSLEERRRKLALCLYRHGAVAGGRMDIDPQERQVWGLG